jgi:hypothetical protein
MYAGGLLVTNSPQVGNHIFAQTRLRFQRNACWKKRCPRQSCPFPTRLVYEPGVLPRNACLFGLNRFGNASVFGQGCRFQLEESRKQAARPRTSVNASVSGQICRTQLEACWKRAFRRRKQLSRTVCIVKVDLVTLFAVCVFMC